TGVQTCALPISFELPKMQATIQYGSFNSPERDNAVEVTQTFPFPSSISARRTRLNAEKKGVEVQRENTLAVLRKEVRLAYHQVRYLQKRQLRLRRLDSLFEQFVAAATLRFQAGESGQLPIRVAENRRGE